MARFKAVVVGLSTLGLAGCAGSGMGDILNGGKSTPVATNSANINVQARNPLTIPPDLKLKEPPPPPPNMATAGIDPNVGAAAQRKSGIVSAGGAAGRASVAPPPPDVYAKYGISKTNPDGTPKSPDQLQAELKAAVIAQKKAQNPNYGTIFNMGSVFTDDG